MLKTLDGLPPIKIDPDTFLYNHCALPSLPAILTKFQELMNSGIASFTKITELIIRDTSLTAQVLKIVNSAYYSLPVDVTRVKVAVAYLGINEIHRIVLSISIINCLSNDEEEYFSDIWTHSLHTALCAKNLALRYEPLLDSGEIWTLGLLHDIGKLVYLKFFPDHYKEIYDYSQTNGCLFSEAEKEYLVPTSAYLGSLLCDRWRLPKRIKDSCLYHSLYDMRNGANDNIKNPFVRVVALSNLLSTLAIAKLNQTKQNEITKLIGDTLGLDKTNLLSLINEHSKLKEEVIMLI